MEPDPSQVDLGNILCASRQSTRKELQVLASAGFAKVHHGRITVLNVNRFNDRHEPLLGAGNVTLKHPRPVPEPR